MNDKVNLTQTAKEQEDKAVDAVISIMLVFTALLLAFCLGYYLAMNEALALVKTI
jgi:phosphate/sulfate permease